MRKVRFFSAVYALLGIAAAAVGVFLALSNMFAGPVLMEEPEAARKQVQSMLDAMCDQDYETVSACLYGQPDLGLDREAADPVGQMFWEAVSGSFTWESRGNFYATDSGVALDVTISAIDLNSLTENLRQRAQGLLEERVRAAEDASEIYDENNEYKTEFVMAVLQDAAEDALEQDARTISWDLTLNLVYENDRWWIMPEQPVLEALSGGILG